MDGVRGAPRAGCVFRLRCVSETTISKSPFHRGCRLICQVLNPRGWSPWSISAHVCWGRGWENGVHAACDLERLDRLRARYDPGAHVPGHLAEGREVPRGGSEDGP